MGIQIKKHYFQNGQLSHNFVIINNKIVKAERFGPTGNFIDDQPWLYNFKIQDLRYFFWSNGNASDAIEIIDDY